MKLDDWKVKAKAEGRVCPECGQPVSKETWELMNKTTPIGKCWSCRYAHWEVPVHFNEKAYSEFDNADRDSLTYLRQAGVPSRRTKEKDYEQLPRRRRKRVRRTGLRNDSME